MAGITPGSGGTLQNATVEGQLLELAQYIANMQADETKNPGQLDYFQVDASDDLNLITIQYNIPIQAVAATGGGSIYAAAEFLSNPGFTAGTSGTITDDSTVGYWKRLVEHAQQLEAPLQPGTDNINGTINLNTNIFSGQVTLPIAPTIADNGTITLTATEFL